MMYEDDVNAEPPIPRRQYLTRSKATATSGRSEKIPQQSLNKSSSTETTGNIAYASSPSL